MILLDDVNSAVQSIMVEESMAAASPDTGLFGSLIAHGLSGYAFSSSCIPIYIFIILSHRLFSTRLENSKTPLLFSSAEMSDEI